DAAERHELVDADVVGVGRIVGAARRDGDEDLRGLVGIVDRGGPDPHGRLAEGGHLHDAQRAAVRGRVPEYAAEYAAVAWKGEVESAFRSVNGGASGGPLAGARDVDVVDEVASLAEGAEQYVPGPGADGVRRTGHGFHAHTVDAGIDQLPVHLRITRRRVLERQRHPALTSVDRQGGSGPRGGAPDDQDQP